MTVQNYIRNFINSFNGSRAALLAGLAFVFATKSFAATGDFDLNFGAQGRATIPGLTGTTKAVAVQPDGKNVPQAGDFDKDGKADYAVFRPANSTWYVARPNGVPAQNFDSLPFGAAGDAPSN